MDTDELIKEIQRLPVPKRIYIIEKTIRSIRIYEDKIRTSEATEKLYSDYLSDKELTAFTELDFEDFYEAK